MLTERRKKLLQYIVEEHVQSAQPVGSGALRDKYKLAVSSATIRNEMAALEEEGYITHPHTSAGRVPTDAGYRYYVESLMLEERLPDDAQQTIRHQFHQAARELEEWAHLAAAILASRVHNAAVVTTPHSPEPRIRQVEVVGVHENLALLIVVLQEARVLQQTITLATEHSQDDLSQIARKLNEELAGKSAPEIRALTLDLSPAETAMVEAAAGLIESADEIAREPSYIEGMRDLLRQPEFSQGERLLGLMEVLEGHNLPRAIPSARSAGDVSIIIGAEHPVDEMRACTVITTGYSGPSGLRGRLSVVGPTRMHYPNTVATVRYMSALMEELLRVYFK